MYLDIDSLDERKSFTWDMEEFAGLPEYLDYLHTVHINNIIIIVSMGSCIRLKLISTSFKNNCLYQD